MLASSRENKLYLASGANTTPTSRVYRLTFDPAGPGFSLDGYVELSGIRDITSVVEDPRNGTLYVTGFFFNFAELPDEFATTTPIFTTPQWATVVPSAVNWSTSTPETRIASTIGGGTSSLALPISAVFVAGASIPADLDGDQDVDADDFTAFSNCWTGPHVPYTPLPAGCTLTPDGNGKIPADFDRDGDVDQADFGFFQRSIGP
jgi:hypothetical protein